MEPRVEKVKRVKAAMRSRGIRYQDVARLATRHNPKGVAWWTVWAVINGRKTSANVLDALIKLVPEAKILR